jgi:hypothetical protein
MHFIASKAQVRCIVTNGHSTEMKWEGNGIPRFLPAFVEITLDSRILTFFAIWFVKVIIPFIFAIECAG